jgi:hypothetical protein
LKLLLNVYVPLFWHALPSSAQLPIDVEGEGGGVGVVG